MSDGSTAPEWVATGSVTVRVPGKVNLYLAVGDIRDDGYHELTTVFHAVSLLDEVTVRNSDVMSLEITGEGADDLPADERNLAWQAAELMAEHVGRAPDVAITIEKCIPVAGGMAGGSADAAAVLVAMNTLWELGVPRRDLHALATQLGSDVPFTLHGGTALGSGRGDELVPVLARTRFTGCWHSRRGHVHPFGVRRVRPPPQAGQPPRLPESQPLLAALAAGDPTELAPLLGNELQAAAVSLEPSIRSHVAGGHRGRGTGWHRIGIGPTCAFLCHSAAGRRRRRHATGRGRGVPHRAVASGPVQGARLVPAPGTWV